MYLRNVGWVGLGWVDGWVVWKDGGFVWREVGLYVGKVVCREGCMVGGLVVQTGFYRRRDVRREGDLYVGKWFCTEGGEGGL